MRYLLRLFLLTACISSTAAHGQTKSARHVDPSRYVVFKFDKTNDFVFMNSDHARPTTLSPSEVDDMESLVDSAYQQLLKNLPANYQGLKHLSAYKRQYVAIINGKGQKEVRINFFCDAPKDWRKNVIIVEDGGACYLQITINCTLRKASELIPNGVA
jgi:hypothetical protein